MSSSPVPANSAAGVSQQPLSPPPAPEPATPAPPPAPEPTPASVLPAAPAPATPDLATADLTATDLATPDLATPDLATPDLATADLTTADLAAPDPVRPRPALPGLPTPGPVGPGSSRPGPAGAGSLSPELAPPGTVTPAPAARGSARRRRRVDGYSVAALVTGILALVPFALCFAVAGLVRTRRGRRAGRAAAIGGLVLACAWAVAGAAVAAVLLNLTPGQAPHPRPLRGTVFGLRAGQCANTARNGVDAARAVPCAEPHQVEIYATFRLAGAAWPGTAALGQRASLGCLDRVGGYLNPGLLGTSLTGSYVYPDEGAWAAGERTVVCEIRGTSGPLTGSVRGLGRTPA